MNTTELPQYCAVVDALTPVLYNLPGKIIAIDGRPGSGKTTLGRYLAWRFNITLLEADLFLHEGLGRLEYRANEIENLIAARLSKPRPIIVDSVAVLRLLQSINRKADSLIYVRNTGPAGSEILKAELDAYDVGYKPRLRADLIVEINV
jgi:nucleoside-triphosphatase THEP1